MRAGELKHKKQALAKRMMLIICIALPSLAIIGFMISGPIRSHKKAQNDATVLLQALSAYATEQGELPHGSYVTICQLLRGKSVDGQNSKRLEYIESEGVEANAKGEIIDPWGNPYRISFDKKLKVYSCGANSHDDQGNGDDIVAQ